MFDLFMHQKDAVKFAIKNNGRCALFHEPGLGKTLSCLEIYTYYKIADPDLKLLVVCPLSLINSAWGEDIQKFTKTIDKCMDIWIRHQQKPKKLISKTERNKLLRVALQNKKAEIIQLRREKKPKRERSKSVKTKKWREKDKKILLDKVKNMYLSIKKIRMNLIRVDPMIDERKRHEK